MFTTEQLLKHLSENSRQSFMASGIKYSKEYWNEIEKKLKNVRHFN